MPYVLALLLVILSWWMILRAAGALLRTRQADWADMAVADDPGVRRRVGQFVLLKHVMLTALMICGLAFLLYSYPGNRTATLLVGVGWSLLLFPVGLLAIPLILWWWF